MIHTHMLAIITRFGFSTNCRKKTAIEAVRDCAEKGNIQAIRCLRKIADESGSADIGDIVTVTLQDENGLPIEATGKVDEILEEYE